jgi:hypothetical protein
MTSLVTIMHTRFVQGIADTYKDSVRVGRQTAQLQLCTPSRHPVQPDSHTSLPCAAQLTHCTVLSNKHLRQLPLRLATQS